MELFGITGGHSLLSFLVLGSFMQHRPIYGLYQLSRKLGSLNRAAPLVFNHIGVALAGVLALGLFWGEYFFLVKEIPVRTALLLGTIAVSAVAVNFVFKAEVWCRYICPMGYFSGLFSCLSSVELRANNNVCSSQCRSTDCYKGEKRGLPDGFFPVF
jgi:polyferredoxin